MIQDYESITRAETRLDASEDARLARLNADGYTHCRCDRCGEIRKLNWLNGHCNNYDPNGPDEMCMGRYVLPTLTLTNPVTGAAQVPVLVGA